MEYDKIKTDTTTLMPVIGDTIMKRVKYFRLPITKFTSVKGTRNIRQAQNMITTTLIL